MENISADDLLGIELLVVSVNEKPNLIEKLNWKGKFVIANQCSETTRQCFDDGIFISTETKGVGVNRNIALIFSSSNYILISDHDTFYYDGIEDKICQAFKKVPKADILIFNIETKGAIVNRRQNTKIKRVRLYNFLNYGAVRIGAKKQSILDSNIWFSSQFGGGTLHSCGEDTLFLRDCLKKKLKIYTYPLTICEVDQSTSTWFQGYNEKYFRDKNILFRTMFPRFYWVFNLYYLFKMRKMKNGDFPLFKCFFGKDSYGK